ncbi:MAG: potassium transporter TrkG [Candidatus Ozemobacteraceae bacterium]
MLLRPPKGEPLGLLYSLGNFSIFLGFFIFVSVLVSLSFQEYGTAVRLGMGSGTAILLGLLMKKLPPAPEGLSLSGAFALATMVWIHATLVTGFSYWATGYFNSYLDACFDAMSGYTTTGLTILQDLDHAPEGLQFLRHAVTFLGGQGIIVLFLMFASQGAAELYQLYVGEGKDERLWPNVLHTARAIWWISMVYLVLGTALLYPVFTNMGMKPVRAFLDALYLFEGAWSTGGFAPHTQNLMYYHSTAVELITMVIFILGSLNFAVHHQVVQGNFREMYKNSEVRSFAFTLFFLTLIATWYCAKANIYPTFSTSFRKVFYQMASAHTTTGNMTLYARQFVHDWPAPALFCLILAMVIGGSACSTAGGLKGMRLAQAFHSLLFEIRKILLPSRAVSTLKMHHRKPFLFTQEHGYKALFIISLFMALFAGSTFAGLLAGFPLMDSFFEGVSAASNSGLSCGITTAGMPGFLKVVYIIAMFLGRLEFIAVFAFVGYLFTLAKGR